MYLFINKFNNDVIVYYDNKINAAYIHEQLLKYPMFFFEIPIYQEQKKSKQYRLIKIYNIIAVEDLKYFIQKMFSNSNAYVL